MVQYYCCNPFGKPNHKNRKIKSTKLRNVTHAFAASARTVKIRLKANKKLCQTCRLEIGTLFKREKQRQNQVEENVNLQQVQQPVQMAVEVSPYIRRSGQEAMQRIAEQQGLHENMDVVQEDDVITEGVPVQATTSGSSDEFVDTIQAVDLLNKVLPLIGAERIDKEKLGTQAYCQHMMSEIQTNIGKKIFGITPFNEIEPSNENDEQEMIRQLKHKFGLTTDKEEKIRILSVLPHSWSANKIHNEFGVSFHLATVVKNLVKEKGILCVPNKRMASHVIPPETVKLVRDFYLLSDISYVCPGKRDYVTINENNEKTKAQRRLLLMNLREAYHLFKEEN